MDRTLTGAITQKYEVETGISKKGDEWKSQKIMVVDESGKYPETACFKFNGKSVDILANYKVGSVVTVHYNISSRDYNGKAYTDLVAWQINNSVTSNSPRPTDVAPKDEPFNSDEAIHSGNANFNDGLPF